MYFVALEPLKEQESVWLLHSIVVTQHCCCIAFLSSSIAVAANGQTVTSVSVTTPCGEGLALDPESALRRECRVRHLSPKGDCANAVGPRP